MIFVQEFEKNISGRSFSFPTSGCMDVLWLTWNGKLHPSSLYMSRQVFVIALISDREVPKAGELSGEAVFEPSA